MSTTTAGGASVAQRRDRPPRRRRRLHSPLTPYLLLLPCLFVLAVLLIVPLIKVIDLSFQQYGLKEINRGLTHYIGWRNYAEILRDPSLYKIVFPNTVGFAICSVSLTMIVGTLVALFLNRLSATWRAICSSAIMVAWAMPAVTGTYVWVWLFDPLNGLVANVLHSMGLLDPATNNWFTHRFSFYAIVLLNIVHHGFPFIAVTVLAGLMTVPKEFYEAATMDGASGWRQFWSITVPTLRPVFAVCTILSTIWDSKIFTQVYLMPGGDGANPEVYNLGVWSYISSFAQHRYGYGSAIAVLLTLVLLVVTIVYLRTLFREDDDL